MKSLRIRFTAIAVTSLALSLLTVMGLNLWLQQSDRVEAQGRTVQAAARAAGESYVTRRTQNAQLATRLSGDQTFVQAAFRGSLEEVHRRIAQITPLSAEEFVAVVDAEQRVLTVAVSAQSVLDSAQIASSLSSQGATDSPLLSVVGALFGAHAVEFSERGATFWVITGFHVAPALEQTLANAFGDTLSIRVLAAGERVIANTVALPLDATEDLELRVALIPRQSSFSVTDPALLNQLALVICVFSAAALFCAVLFSRTFRHRIEEPVMAVRRNINRVRAGELQKPINRQACAPFLNIAHDLEAMREALCDRENRIMHHAEYDALTGLTNRSVIAEKLKMAMSRAERRGNVVSALAIDLSRFSEINGSMGHEVGDEVLKEIARRLASNARITDTVARVGGDEFFVILEDDDTKLALSLAKFMVSSLTTPIVVNECKIKLSIHAGIAFFPQHCDSAEALRRMANIGLYTAKEQGKPLVGYEPGQDEKHLRELAIIHDLPNAIQNNELYLQYQPKIDMETQQVRQVEALVRWRHPQLGFIPPDEFIALLEKSGMISKLTNWVFKEAVKQARAWMDEGYDLAIAVNISANDLSDDKLAERLKLLLHHHLVDASKITIEVTESAVIRDPENSVKLLKDLKAAGIRCALDDFGTGQTSLALLKQLPISEIKIDKSFVQNLRADSGDAIIVKSIIDLGHNMGLHVTAEGVESNYCWNLLNSYGCNLIQGYLVSAPLTADELTEWHLRLQDRHLNKLDLSFVHDMTA